MIIPSSSRVGLATMVSLREKEKKRCSKLSRGAVEKIAGLVCFEADVCEFWTLKLNITNPPVSFVFSVLNLQHLRRASFL